MAKYYNANICERGHVIDKHTRDGAMDEYCSSCGAHAVDRCLACDAPVRGARIGNMGMPMGYARPPAHCFNCGAAHPWTESALAAIREFATEDGSLDEAEVEQLASASARLGDETETTDTTLAVSRFRRITGKLGTESGNAVRSIATNIASAAVRQQLDL